MAVFVNNGLLRLGEAPQVVKVFQESMGAELVAVDAVDDFMHALQNIIDPEQKRRIIGEKFIRIFEAQARQLGIGRFLVQGTIYPDVVESSAPDRAQAARRETAIKRLERPAKLALVAAAPPTRDPSGGEDPR